MTNIRLTVIIVFICISTSIFGQIKDFRLYQETINKAELYIVNENKIQALNSYYNLLTTSDGNFSKDIYNSLILAKELNRFDTLFKLLDLVKAKNFDNAYLSGLEEFSDLHENVKWQEFINSNNNVIYIDSELRNKINDLHTRDQFFRIKEGSYGKYGDTIRKIDSINMNYLLSLMSNGSLPGEKEIGARDFRGGQGYDIVLHHYMQNRSRNKKLLNITPILVNQVLEGRIEPNKCALWLEYQNGEFIAGVFDVARVSYDGKTSKYYSPPYSKEKKLLIDAYRKWIYLEPIEDYYKKVLFVTNNEDNNFKFDIRLNTFQMSSETDFFNYQTKMIELK